MANGEHKQAKGNGNHQGRGDRGHKPLLNIICAGQVLDPHLDSLPRNADPDEDYQGILNLLRVLYLLRA